MEFRDLSSEDLRLLMESERDGLGERVDDDSSERTEIWGAEDDLSALC